MTSGGAVIEVLGRGEEGDVSGAKNGGGWCGCLPLAESFISAKIRYAPHTFPLPFPVQ